MKRGRKPMGLDLVTRTVQFERKHIERLDEMALNMTSTRAQLIRNAISDYIKGFEDIT